MKDFFYAFKVSGLFIGTVIGAGFATGEEIRLYFRGQNDLTVIISALVFALFCALFLFASKKKKPPLRKWIKIVWEIAKFLCAGISLVAMCSACEQIIFGAIGFKSAGVWLFALCAVLGEKENKVLAFINAVIVPIIVIFIIGVYIGADTESLYVATPKILPAFLYSAMNIFGGAIMLDRMGAEMSKKQIIHSTVISFVIMCLLMLCIKKIVETNSLSMPLLCVAKDNKMVISGILVVLLAVFTTMLSDVSIMYDSMSKVASKKCIRILVLCAFCLIGICSDFSKTVSTLYPVISYCGVVYVLHATVRLIAGDFLFDKYHNRIHCSCQSAKNYGAGHN